MRGPNEPMEEAKDEEKTINAHRRRMVDIFFCREDPGPCEFACGACILCRCHRRFVFQPGGPLNDQVAA